MKHASLFTGIGGFDLSAEWMGWHNVFQVEIDEWCQKLLKQNFPNAQRYRDIKEFNGTQYSGAIDVLSGGFPCQPFSTAGKRKGKADDRHLWPEMLRVIREVSPRWVVGENVRGLTNWNGGLVFDEVQSDLEAAGYEVLPFLLPACAVNAPHRRDRIWFVAYSASVRFGSNVFEWDTIQRREQACGEVRAYDCKAGTSSYSNGGNGQHLCGHEPCKIPETKKQPLYCNCCSNEHVTYTNVRRLDGRESKKKRKHPTDRDPWSKFPTQSPVCGGNDGVSYRVDRIKGLGNAVVPQVVYQIFKAIQEYENIANGA